MNKSTLKDSVKQIPFRPFVLRLVDGQDFKIDDPDRIAVSPSQEIAVFFDTDHYYVIDTEKITVLEVSP